MESNKELEEFKTFWKDKKVDRTLIINVAKNTYDALKKETTAVFEHKLKKKDKNIINLETQCKNAAETIGKHLNQTNEEIERYKNPYSIAQLYAHLEKEVSVFSNICPICMSDNNWRMELAEYNGEKGAICKRLSSDTIRPFDGFLGRMLEKIGNNVVNQYFEYLDKNKIDSQKNFTVPIILEQNKFEFSDSLKELKPPDKKKKNKKNEDNFLEFESKKERIKNDSKDICPYTGKIIGENGEIDHIIPRSFSMQNFGFVFNSEANLIYCSIEGNQNKGNHIYSLNNIHQNYLNAHYGNVNRDTIKSIITANLDKILEKYSEKELRNFYKLGDEERRDIRLGLFISDYPQRNKLIKLLNTSLISIVNGTQAYLAKIINKKIKKHYPQANVKIYQVKNEIVSELRERASKEKEELKKADKQGIFSHIIDAGFTLNGALFDKQFIKKVLKLDKLDIETLKDFPIPEEIKIIYLERIKAYRKETFKDFASRQIFKEGIYGERFVPILMDKENIYLGFNLKDAIKVSHNKIDIREKWFKTLKPYLVLPENLNFLDCIEKLKTQNYLKFSVNKQNAFALFEKAHHQQNLTDEEKIAKDILMQIYYNIQKESIEKFMANEKNKENIAEFMANEKNKENNNEKNKLIEKMQNDNKIKIENIPKELGKIENKPLYPAFIQEWENFFKARKQEKDINLKEFIKKYFIKDQNLNSSQYRKKARKVFSLPFLKNPSGGFRIKRKTITQEEIYQMIEVNGPSISGFSVNEQNFQKSQPILIKQLQNSKRITPKDLEENINNSNICWLDEWIKVFSDDKVEIEYARGTESRAYCRIKMKWEDFNKLYEPKYQLYTIPNKLDFQFTEFSKQIPQAINLIMKPRNKIKIEILSDKWIQFQYTTASEMTAQIKTKYFEEWSKNKK